MPPWVRAAVLPLTLALAALVAVLVAGHGLVPGWLLGLALLLSTCASLLAGALWARQRQMERLRDARQQAQLLGQLVDVWCWQTDAEHRLVKLQPPGGAPASSWVAGSASGTCLWQRFDDEAHSLQPRMQARTALGLLRVWQPQPDGAPRPWALRGLPRLDGHGRFEGYTGVAWPAEAQDQAAAARGALTALLANDTACLPWPAAAGALPEGLRQQALALAPDEAALADGWTLQLQQREGGQQLTLRRAEQARSPAAEVADQALVAEHAAFTYTISHDLRAPLRVVEGFGRILKEDYGSALDRVGRDHVDRVLAAAARMNHMIDALLSLSRLSTQPLQRQPVNLSQLAGWVVDECRRAAPERQVSVHIAPDMSAHGDPTLLRMALENLLGNAFKYSAKVAQAEVRFEPELLNGRPGFVVSDNGAGFDMRFADRLFGVFQRLHSNSDFQGTGVGLASVRRIVRRHGGEIWADSEVGRGARFHFTLRD